MGRTNCCQRLQVLGVHRDGGACEFIAVPERHVVPADGLTVDQAAMVEFLAIGAHGVARAGVGPQHRVLIVGAGPIGIAAAIFCKARGAEVTVVDRSERRLAFALDEVGVDQCSRPPPTTSMPGSATATDGDYFDVVIDATGSPAAMQAGFAYVGHGGTYVLLSIVRADIAFNDPEFHKRETVAARQPQRHPRRFRGRADGDARGQGADGGAREPCRPARRGALADTGLVAARGRRDQGAGGDLRLTRSTRRSPGPVFGLMGIERGRSVEMLDHRRLRAFGIMRRDPADDLFVLGQREAARGPVQISISVWYSFSQPSIASLTASKIGIAGNAGDLRVEAHVGIDEGVGLAEALALRVERRLQRWRYRPASRAPRRRSPCQARRSVGRP